MKKIVNVARIIFGIMLLGFGALVFYNAPLPSNYPAATLAFLTAVSTGYMRYLIGLIFLTVGFMFVTKRYVALGTILLAPIIVNILLFHIFFDIKTIVPGLIFTVLEIFVVCSEWDKYKSLLKAR